MCVLQSKNTSIAISSAETRPAYSKTPWNFPVQIVMYQLHLRLKIRFSKGDFFEVIHHLIWQTNFVCISNVRRV